MNKKELGKSLLLLFGIIILFSLFAHSLLGNSETLDEYEAKRHPDKVPEATTETVSENESFDVPQNSISENSVLEIDVSANEDTIPSDRKTYQEGFYYESLNDEIKKRITGISYPEDCPIPYEDLVYVKVLHYNFDGEVNEGELICNKEIAKDIVEIFYELYLAEYQIEKMVLIDEYDGDDTASMSDNNTSCFNYRVVDGTSNLSKHAYGLAIDINPFYNPYVKFNKDGSLYISPKGSETYADRTAAFPYKIDETDLCYRLFTERGFIWGGNWNSVKDYQHFQITLPENE